MLNSILDESMLKKAVEREQVEYNIINLFDFSDNHDRIDDYPFGGGKGMIMKAEPIFKAIESIGALCLPHLHPENRNIILSPQDNTQNEIFVFKVGGMDHGQYNSLRGYITGNT